MSYPAVKIAKDKHITSQILASHNLPVVDEMLVSADDLTEPDKVSQFLGKHGQVVVKPLDASHGKGITVGVSNLEQLKTAVDEALKNSEKTHVLVQRQVQGYDVRLLFIDYKFIDAITRVPASVTGDGRHTVSELIDITNQSPDRGENYKARLNVIPLDKASEFLGEEGLRRVPKAGERVQVIGVSNLGMGGERLNVELPDFLMEIGEQVTRILELPVCGVDFLVSSLPTSSSTPEQLNPIILEANECPILTMYDDVQSTKQTAIVDSYLDLVSKY
jgi:cyanophycin synthetase